MLVFLLALMLRIHYQRLAGKDVLIVRDAKQYVDYADNLVHHGTFSKERTDSPRPDSYRSPGYPLLIAMTKTIAGDPDDLRLLLYIQALLSALLVLLTFYVGLFCMPPAAAMAAAVLVAFSPHLITIADCVLTETLFSFLLLAAAGCLLMAIRNASYLLHGISAVLFGAAYMTNEAALFLPFLLIPVVHRFHGKHQTEQPRKMTLRALATFLLIFSLFPFAWAIRNQVSVPEGAPKGSQRAVVTMSHGAYPGFVYKNPLYQRFPYREDPNQPEFGSSLSYFFRILRARAQEEPLRYLQWYLVGKPYYLWRWDILQGVGDIYINPVDVSLFQASKFAAGIRSVMKGLHPLILVLALLTLPTVYLERRRAVKAGDPSFFPFIPLSICVYFTALYMIFAPWPRYGIPLRPELYLCAVWTAFFLLRRLHGRMRGGNG